MTPGSNPTRLLLLGAPGSGKGTQGKRLAERYGARHVSTGDLLRAQVQDGTELGRQAEPFMDRGDLVPDELLVEMVLQDVLGPNSPPSYVLDGFPRTLRQAQAAYEQAVRTDRILQAVICLDIGHEELIARLSQRGMEHGRQDDNETTIRHRIDEYEQKTLPLLEYYAGRGILVRLEGTGAIDEVTTRIFAALEAMPGVGKAGRLPVSPAAGARGGD